MGNDRVVVTVMTQNMDEGSDFPEINAARTYDDFIAAVTTTYQKILATKPGERAAAMALEIAKKQPDLVALHEASILRIGPLFSAPPPPSATDVKMDLIGSLLSELGKLGQPYALVVDPNTPTIGRSTNLDFEAPSTLEFDVRLTDQDAIIARTDIDMRTTAVEVKHFSDVQTTTTAVGSITIPGGWVQLDATIRGLPLRFVSVHLDPGPDFDVQANQATELVQHAGTTDLPIVFGGDFNAPPVNVPGNPHYKTYQNLIGSGLTDAWNKDDPGFTCCQDANLLNPDSKLSYRIDMVLYRGGLYKSGVPGKDWSVEIDVDNIELVGDKQGDKTPSGLWPSDHAGVVATLGFTQKRVVD
jgi:hypothetical protein